MWRIWLMAVLLASSPACKKDSTPTGGNKTSGPRLPPPPKPQTPVHAQATSTMPDAGPRPDASTDYRCKSDTDCTVSCDIPGSCCAEPCTCTRPFHKRELRAARKQNQEMCAMKDVACKKADCAAPREDYLARCKDEKCIAVKVPRHSKSTTEYTCTQDSDCVVSCIKANQRCPQLCTCNQTYHKDELAEIERVHGKRYSDEERQRCPVAKCAKPLYRTEASCQKGRCVGKRVRF